MSDNKDADAKSTQQIHHEYVPPAGFDAVAPALHRASTVLFEDVAAMRASHWLDKNTYTYGLHGTPTSFTLEARRSESTRLNSSHLRRSRMPSSA